MNKADTRNPLAERITAALIGCAAFAWSSAIVLALGNLLRGVAPTPFVAVGRVTVDRASKLQDYLTASSYYLLVPVGTVLLYAGLRRLFDRLRSRVTHAPDARSRVAIPLVVFTLPLFASPFLWLTTRKEGWAILLPIFLSVIGVVAWSFFEEHLWIRSFFSEGVLPFHALLIAEGSSWLLFRYLVTGRRIAHIPTLFLEAVFVFFFVAIFWGAAVLIARVAMLLVGADPRRTLRRIAVGAFPLVSLAPLGLTLLPAQRIAVVVFTLALGGVLLFSLVSWLPSPRAVRRLVSILVVPTLLLCASYGSIESPSNWVDLFHRGESLGPASDYLRGKVPYRDVFVLHGMLDDGFLDAGLMHLLGRRAEVSALRLVMLSTLVLPALWALGLVIFDSMPAALLVVGLGLVTSAENQRAILEIFVVTLLLVAIRRGRAFPAGLAGLLAGIVLFQSLEIGIYSIAGGFAAVALWAVFTRRCSVPERGRPGPVTIAFAAGVMVGVAPFVAWLAMHAALGPFLRDSFVTIPATIDAIWSLPFPELGRRLGSDLGLRTLADFLVTESVRFVLNPIVITIALAVLLNRLVRRRVDALTLPLLVVTVFALLTQRSALGRADFPHQYFSAFLLAPIVAILIVVLTRQLGTVWTHGETAERALVGLFGAVLLPFLAIALWIPDLANSRLDDLVRYRARITGSASGDSEEARIRERINALGYTVAQLAPAGAPVFDFSNQPALYFYLDRPNPTRFYQVPVLSPPVLQAEAIRDLDRAKPPVVLRRSPEGYDRFDEVPNDLRAAAVAAYIDDRYQFYRRVGGVELWVRQVFRGPLDLERYLSAIHQPSQREVVETRWLVFPSIARIRDEGVASWSSDLTVHNPFGEPLPLRLRYVGPAAVERRIQVPPHQTLHWEDVVARLFGAQSSVGSLWIEYPQDRRPATTVVTYDSTRRSSVSVLRPLDPGNAAGAGTSILFVGIPAVGKRLNIGMLNTGEGAADIRLRATAADGSPRGIPVERKIGEYETWILTDASDRLGATIDSSTALHVDVSGGSVVAFASWIDPDSGESGSLDGTVTVP